MKADYVQIDDSWANSVYMYGGTGITITNSKIGKSEERQSILRMRIQK